MRSVDRALWIGVIVPPAAWTTHLLLGYGLTSLQCAKHLPVAPLTHVVGLVAIAAALLAVGAAAWAFRNAGRPTPLAASIARVDRRRSMAIFAMCGGALFTVGILYGEVGAVVLRACA